MGREFDSPVIRSPQLSRILFQDRKFSAIWLPIRLYVAWQWLAAGFEKLGSPVWTGREAGVVVAGFARGALAQTSGAHPNVLAPVGSFLQAIVIPHAPLFSLLVSGGEIAVGAALLLGAFTGLAALCGTFLNVNYLLAGAVSTNPEMLLLQLLLILGWRVSGQWGADRWLISKMGAPWQRGPLREGASVSL